jgi:hypothetical protein
MIEGRKEEMIEDKEDKIEEMIEGKKDKIEDKEDKIEGKKEEMIEDKEDKIEGMIEGKKEEIIEETNKYLTEDIKGNSMEEITEEFLDLNFQFITIGIFRCHQWSIYQ